MNELVWLHDSLLNLTINQNVRFHNIEDQMFQMETVQKSKNYQNEI